MNTARIYVAALADYNNGRLHGVWIDLDGIDDVEEMVAKMLRESKYPNVMVTCPDCDGRQERVIGHNSETGDTRIGECETCKGRGEVPSAEEYAVHDMEYCPSSFGEYTPLSKFIEYGEAYEEHGEPYRHWVDNTHGDRLDPKEFQEEFCGEFDSEEEFADQLADDSGLDRDSFAGRYFDTASYLNDLKQGGEYWFERDGGTVYVFRND